MGKPVSGQKFMLKRNSCARSACFFTIALFAALSSVCMAASLQEKNAATVAICQAYLSLAQIARESGDSSMEKDNLALMLAVRVPEELDNLDLMSDKAIAMERLLEITDDTELERREVVLQAALEFQKWARRSRKIQEYPTHATGILQAVARILIKLGKKEEAGELFRIIVRINSTILERAGERKMEDRTDSSVGKDVRGRPEQTGSGPNAAPATPSDRTGTQETGQKEQR